jgi:alpha-amylase
VDRNIYIILSGSVKVTRTEGEGENKKEIQLATLSSESVIGEISVLTGRQRSANVTALVETTALRLNIEEIESRDDTKPIHKKLLGNLAEELSKKLIYAENKVVQFDKTAEVETEAPDDELMHVPSTILALFGWKWLDIMYEAPFLAHHGYDAIKISPPQEHVVRTGNPWWCIYQPVTYQLDRSYGTEEDFVKMIDLCHSFNIKVYVDLLLNHMAEYSEAEKTHVGSNGNTFSKDHYGPLNKDNDYYEYDDFYHFAEDKTKNLQVTDEDYSKLERFWHLEHFDLLNLPKLNLDSPRVIEVMRKYVKYLLSLGVDGFRIDAAKHLKVSAVEKILKDLRTKEGLKPFIYQEYYVGLPIGIDVYGYMEKYFRIGYVTSFNYGAFLADALRGKNNNLQKLVEFSFGSSWLHYPENRAVVVIDNHDTERMMPTIPNYKSTENNEYTLAYIFMLAWPFGIPKIMSSFRFSGMDDAVPEKSIWNNGSNTCFDKDSPWVCQHRWNAICNMVLFRQKTKKAKGITHTWANGNQIAFSRSHQKSGKYIISVGFVVINATEKTLKRKFETGLPDGEYYNLITSKLVMEEMQGETVEIKNYGFAEIEVKPYDAVCLCVNFMEQE